MTKLSLKFTQEVKITNKNKVSVNRIIIFLFVFLTLNLFVTFQW